MIIHREHALMPPKPRRQVGKGQVGSRIAETVEESYYDIIDYFETKREYIEDRLKVLTNEKKKQFIQKYISKMQALLDSMPPEIIGCLNAEFPDVLFFPYTRYEQDYYMKLRTILQFILTENERMRFQQTRETISFYTHILERFNDEAFLNAYIKKYSKPINMYAFYIVRTLKNSLSLAIRTCMYRLQQAQQVQRGTPHDTREYKNRLTTTEKNAFTYKWLKTEEDIKSICKDADDGEDGEDDECDCALLMTPLEPNKAFSITYELEGKSYTECFDEFMVFREAALPYKYYRHHILKDKYIDMGAIRALKTDTNANVSGGRASSTAAKPKGVVSSRGRSASGGKQVVNRASKSKPSSLIK